MQVVEQLWQPIHQNYPINFRLKPTNFTRRSLILEVTVLPVHFCTNFNLKKISSPQHNIASFENLKIVKYLQRQVPFN